ncbi:MAG: MBL fold metallo-hydrolase [Succinivibrionaceae bacterium]
MLRYLTLPVTAFAQNCRIIYNPQSKNAVICDPGADADNIYRAIHQLKLTTKAILLTHGHLDHCGSAMELSKLLSIDIYGPTKDDNVWLDHMADQSKMFNLPLTDNILVDHFLTDGQKLDFDLDDEINVLHCPGHTPGHVVFYLPKNKILLSGDVIFAGSIGRSDFIFGDPEQLLNCIKEKIMTLPADTKILAGHGPETTIEREAHTNPFLIPDIY